jgi:hypothetical protein
MSEPLSAELENTFIRGFLTEDQLAARALLDVFKAMSAGLSVRIQLEAANVGEINEKRYPRVRGRIDAERAPILWSLCAPSNKPPKTRAHQKIEVLPSETEALRAAGLLGKVMAIGRRAGIEVGSHKKGAILRIGITAAITCARAEEIAEAVAEIAVIALPLYS